MPSKKENKRKKDKYTKQEPEIYLYTLPYCIFSQNALKLVQDMGIPYQNIVVKENEKQKYKERHQMTTFPQIFFKNSKGEMVKIGGYDDLVLILDLCRRRCKKTM